MAALQNITPHSRFHNLSDAALADELGRVDAIAKGAEAELADLKNEFRTRGLLSVAGDRFSVTSSDQVSWHLDTKAVRAHLGDALKRSSTRRSCASKPPSGSPSPRKRISLNHSAPSAMSGGCAPSRTFNHAERQRSGNRPTYAQTKARRSA